MQPVPHVVQPAREYVSTVVQKELYIMLMIRAGASIVRMWLSLPGEHRVRPTLASAVLRTIIHALYHQLKSGLDNGSCIYNSSCLDSDKYTYLDALKTKLLLRVCGTYGGTDGCHRFPTLGPHLVVCDIDVQQIFEAEEVGSYSLGACIPNRSF